MARKAKKKQKGPGKFYRKGISLMDIMEKFPDDATAESWFEQMRWGKDLENLYCPKCGSLDGARPVPSRRPLPFRCNDCRGQFSVRTKSCMERSKIPLRKWAMAIYLHLCNLKGVSSMKIHRDLGITQSSAWFMLHRIRKAYESKSSLMAGPVEVDETFIGGKESNKHAHKKLNAGRGTIGKTAVAGIKDRETKRTGRSG